MDQKIDRILDKIEDLAVEQARTNVRLDTYNAQLAEHIRRTSILEEQMKTALLPIQTGKVAVALSAGAATIYGLIRLLKGV